MEIFKMPQLSRIVLSVLLMSLVSFCKSTAPDANTQLKDIGLINTIGAKNSVLYSEQGQVFLKSCKQVVLPPVTRDCASDGTPKSMSESDYIKKLPFDVGAYSRDQQSLDMVSKFLESARSAAATGNQNAAQTVQKLETIESNLKTILFVRSALTKDQGSVTYFEFNDEYSKLIAPFEVAVNKNSSAGDMPVIPATIGSMTPKQCFAILRREMSRNWYDESLWPACLGGGDLACVVEQSRTNKNFYPEDLSEPCGGVYHMRNQPNFDVRDMPKRPEITLPRTPESRPVYTPPSPTNIGGNSGRPGSEAPACRAAKAPCNVDWQCCSKSCWLDGLCQAGGNGCIARKGFCSASWQCCSKDCYELTHTCM
jgi:hypothetical protein